MYPTKKTTSKPPAHPPHPPKKKETNFAQYFAKLNSMIGNQS
jgi:hypothetical protein